MTRRPDPTALARAVGVGHAPRVPADVAAAQADAEHRKVEARCDALDVERQGAFVARRVVKSGEPVAPTPARGEPGRFAALGAQVRERRSTARRANAAQGRAAREAGESDEAVILSAAREAGWSVRKLPTPYRRVGTAPKGRFLAVYEDDAGCDFRGTAPGGRSLVMEAKGTKSAALPLRPKGKPVLRPRQRVELEECHALGGAAGVLVRLAPAGGPVWLWCPWPAWIVAEDAARTDGRASLSVAALVDAGAVRVPVVGGVPRWTDVVGGVG